jgi:hypothetical protein
MVPKGMNQVHLAYTSPINKRWRILPPGRGTGVKVFVVDSWFVASESRKELLGEGIFQNLPEVACKACRQRVTRREMIRKIQIVYSCWVVVMAVQGGERLATGWWESQRSIGCVWLLWLVSYDQLFGESIVGEIYFCCCQIFGVPKKRTPAPLHWSRKDRVHIFPLLRRYFDWRSISSHNLFIMTTY